MQTQRILEDVRGIRGLACAPRYLSMAEADDLLDLIDSRPWAREQRRRTQTYGELAGGRGSRGAGTLPGWLLALADRLAHDGLVDRLPDSCLVDEYLPGQGGAARLVERRLADGPSLVLALGAPFVVEFSHAASPVKVPVRVEPCSLLVVSEAVRDTWRRAVPARRTDRHDGLTWLRARHVSLTFFALREGALEAAALKYA